MRTLLVAICAASTLLAPATADAAAPKPRKFWIEFEASQNTTWSQPETETKRDCYHTDFHFARGSEKWKLKTRAAIPALFMDAGGTAILYVGIHDFEDLSSAGPFDVGTQRIRQRTERSFTRGGMCGGGFIENPIPPTDCGTRIPTLEVTPFLISGRKDAFKFTVGTESSDPNIDFKSCNVIFPKEITGDRFHAEQVAANYDTFMTAKKAIRITYSKTFRYRSPPRTRPTTSTTKVKWTFTFRPAR